MVHHQDDSNITEASPFYSSPFIPPFLTAIDAGAVAACPFASPLGQFNYCDADAGVRGGGTLDQEPEAKRVKTKDSSLHDAHLAAARTLATMSSRMAAAPPPAAAAAVAVAHAAPAVLLPRGFDVHLEQQQGPVAAARGFDVRLEQQPGRLGAAASWAAQLPPSSLARGLMSALTDRRGL